MAKITTGDMYNQWEQMNQKLEALDNKIDGIIDGTTPANTQLTGSKVELIAMASDLEIATGTNVNIISGFSAHKYNSIFVHIRPRGANKYRVSYRPVLGNSTSAHLLEITILETDGSAANRASEYETVMGLYGSIYLENNTSSDHIFGDIALYGVKS